MRQVIEAIITVVFTAFCTVALIDFLAGCGGTYTDSQGVVYVNECIIFGK